MTKIDRIIEGEKLEYANERERQRARKLLEEGIDVITIMKTTGLDKANVEELKIKSKGA